MKKTIGVLVLAVASAMAGLVGNAVTPASASSVHTAGVPAPAIGLPHTNPCSHVASDSECSFPFIGNWLDFPGQPAHNYENAGAVEHLSCWYGLPPSQWCKGYPVSQGGYRMLRIATADTRTCGNNTAAHPNDVCGLGAWNSAAVGVAGMRLFVKADKNPNTDNLSNLFTVELEAGYQGGSPSGKGGYPFFEQTWAEQANGTVMTFNGNVWKEFVPEQYWGKDMHFRVVIHTNPLGYPERLGYKRNLVASLWEDTRPKKSQVLP